MISPVNSHVVCFASIPDVPSNTYGEKEFKNAKIKVAVSVHKQRTLIRIYMEKYRIRSENTPCRIPISWIPEFLL